MANPLLLASYQNVKSQEEIFWGQWKKVPQDSVGRQINREQHRWKMYSRFLQAIGKAVDPKQTVLYYPAAHVDLNSLLATGLREGVFIDPAYFRRKTMGFTSQQLRQLVRSYKASHFRFSFPHRHLMRARFDIAHQSFQLWILQGQNGEKIRKIQMCIAAKSIVYLVKAAPPYMLTPPASLVRLHPAAFALDYYLPLKEFGIALEGYSGQIFKQRVGKRQFMIFKTYDFRQRSK